MESDSSINYTSCNVGSVGTSDGSYSAPTKSNGIVHSVSNGYTHISCYVSGAGTPPNNATSMYHFGLGNSYFNGTSYKGYPAISTYIINRWYKLYSM